MLQQVMTKPGEIIFREVEIPEVKDDQVLVKIMNIGICGSDIHVYHGKHPFTKYPVTQGHEVSGEIVKLGAGVQNFRVGEKVTIEPQVYCGHCYPCRHGKYNLCEELKVMGFQTTGTASEYFAVDASKVTPIPEDMSYEEGAMIEPLAVAVHGVKQMGDVTGMKIAVLGAGPIGNLVAQTAKGMGADKVMITDVSDLRIIGTEFQRTVKTEFFFIHPVWDTVDNRVLFTVFGNLAFTIAIKQFHKKDIVIADKSYHCSVRRKDGDLLRSAVRQPFNNVVCRNALIISFQRVNVMYSCV